jgi:hypothetical protein
MRKKTIRCWPGVSTMLRTSPAKSSAIELGQTGSNASAAGFGDLEFHFTTVVATGKAIRKVCGGSRGIRKPALPTLRKSSGRVADLSGKSGDASPNAVSGQLPDSRQPDRNPQISPASTARMSNSGLSNRRVRSLQKKTILSAHRTL